MRLPWCDHRAERTELARVRGQEHREFIVAEGTPNNSWQVILIVAEHLWLQLTVFVVYDSSGRDFVVGDLLSLKTVSLVSSWTSWIKRLASIGLLR